MDGWYYQISTKCSSDFQLYVGYDDTWISERDIADDIITSFQNNIEQVEGWEISSNIIGNENQRLIKVCMYYWYTVEN